MRKPTKKEVEQYVDAAMKCHAKQTCNISTSGSSRIGKRDWDKQGTKEICIFCHMMKWIEKEKRANQDGEPEEATKS